MSSYKLEPSKEYFGIFHDGRMYFLEGSEGREILFRSRLLRLPKEIRLLNVMKQSWKRPAREELPEPFPAEMLPDISEKLNVENELDSLIPVLVTDRLKDIQSTICRILTSRGSEIMIEERLYEVIRTAKLGGEEIELFSKEYKNPDLWYIFMFAGLDMVGCVPQYIPMQQEINFEEHPFTLEDYDGYEIEEDQPLIEDSGMKLLEQTEPEIDQEEPEQSAEDENTDLDQEAENNQFIPKTTFGKLEIDPSEIDTGDKWVYLDDKRRKVLYINRLYDHGLQVGIVRESEKLIHWITDKTGTGNQYFKTKKALKEFMTELGGTVRGHYPEESANKVLLTELTESMIYSFRSQHDRIKANIAGLEVYRSAGTALKYTDAVMLDWKNAAYLPGKPWLDNNSELLVDIEDHPNCITEDFPILYDVYVDYKPARKEKIKNWHEIQISGRILKRCQIVEDLCKDCSLASFSHPMVRETIVKDEFENDTFSKLCTKRFIYEMREKYDYVPHDGGYFTDKFTDKQPIEQKIEPEKESFQNPFEPVEKPVIEDKDKWFDSSDNQEKYREDEEVKAGGEFIEASVFTDGKFRMVTIPADHECDFKNEKEDCKKCSFTNYPHTVILENGEKKKLCLVDFLLNQYGVENELYIDHEHHCLTKNNQNFETSGSAATEEKAEKEKPQGWIYPVLIPFYDEVEQKLYKDYEVEIPADHQCKPPDELTCKLCIFQLLQHPNYEGQKLCIRSFSSLQADNLGLKFDRFRKAFIDKEK